jgi:Putative peptidoglycan binding domain
MPNDLLSQLSNNPRLQLAARNSPPMRKGDPDRVAVGLLQQALVLVGFPMPNSSLGGDNMDGIFGQETETTVWKFQSKHGLSADGIFGMNTFDRLFNAVASFVQDFQNLLNIPVLNVAMREVNVSWPSTPDRVKLYFRSSAMIAEDALAQEAKTHATSWCSFFVHWSLIQAGVSPLPPMTAMKGDAIQRFIDTYISPLGKTPADFVPSKYTPKPGDMYYMPFSPLALDPLTPTHHIGFVVGQESPGDPRSAVHTFDGNSTRTRTIWFGGKGGGMVCNNTRDISSIRHYFPLPG